MVQVIERDVYTILDALTQTGGIISILFTFVQYIMNTVESFLYLSSIISKVFWITKINLPKRERSELKKKPEDKHIYAKRSHKP